MSSTHRRNDDSGRPATHQNHDCILGMLYKPPVPGRVKTRLAAHIGHEAATDLYRALLHDTEEVSLASGVRVVAYAAFADTTGEPRRPEVRPQAGGDIGNRMRHALEDLFAEGARRAALIGTDIPGLTANLIVEALDQLSKVDMVTGPTLDGGYYLIGFCREAYDERYFEGIPWSTEQVLAETEARASDMAASLRRLPVLRDLDTVDDLEAHCRNSRLLEAPNRFGDALRTHCLPR